MLLYRSNVKHFVPAVVVLKFFINKGDEEDDEKKDKTFSPSLLSNNDV